MTTELSGAMRDEMEHIQRSLEQWHEGWMAERWLIDGVREAPVNLTGLHEITGLGMSYRGRWVDWNGVRQEEIQEIRGSATAGLQRIEVRSEWQVASDDRRVDLRAEHVRAVPYDDSNTWPANIHVHAVVDDNGEVQSSELRGFRKGEDPTAPTGATIGIALTEDATLGVDWIGRAVARRLKGRNLHTPQKQMRQEWEHLSMSEEAAKTLEEANELRMAELWLNGEEPSNGWGSLRGPRLRSLETTPEGRYAEWREQRITNVGELPSKDQTVPGTVRFRWPWTRPDETAPGTLETAEQIRIDIADARVIANLENGEVGRAWIESGPASSERPRERATVRKSRTLAQWIAKRAVDAARQERQRAGR